MEGVMLAPPWKSPTARLRAPYLPTFPDESLNVLFYNFPQHHSIESVEDATALRLNFSCSSSLTSFMQSWLFFKLLETFLRQRIDPTDFVLNGFIEIDQPAVHAYFSTWKKQLWIASYTKKQAIRRATQDVIDYALAKSAIFEEAAESFGPYEDFDRVVLSIKLLTGLLHAVLDETYSKSAGAFAPWVHTASAYGKLCLYMLNPAARLYKYAKPDFFKDFVSEMSSGDLRKHLYGYQGRLLPLPPGDVGGGRAVSLLLRILESNGWCPFRARQLCMTYDYLTVNHIGGLIRPHPPEENHEHCLEDARCSAHDVVAESTGIYPFRHECDGRCDFVHVPFEEIATIVRSGGIPIVSVRIDGPLDLRVVRCKPRTTYTAISHVWSDGRGNPKENALPLCQLQWLRATVRQTYLPESNALYDPEAPVSSLYQYHSSVATRRRRPVSPFDSERVYFWMDTLCIPVCPESEATKETKELRFAAIQQITPIFSGAFNTLILDRQMQTLSIEQPRQVSGDEFATILFTSKWMERGWTLEEGCLSSMCILLLSGKLYEVNMSLRNLLSKSGDSESPLQRANVEIRRLTVKLLQKAMLEDKRQVAMIPWVPKAKRIWKLMQQPLFVSIWNSLVNRATTRPQDGVLILANLLEYNVHPLVSVPRDQRLMTVLKSCDELPLSLLYNTGPRIEIEGHPELGWMPTDVAGDSLVAGAKLRKLKSKSHATHVTYTVDYGTQRPSSILVLATTPGEHISDETNIIRVQCPMNSDSGTCIQDYILELRKKSATQSDTPFTGHRSQRHSDGHCVIVDFGCGTRQGRGFVGRGVCLKINSRSRKSLDVSYEAPLVVWTPDQWLHKSGRSETPAYLQMDYTTLSHTLTLSYEADLWRKQLIRRPFYSMYPIWAQVVAVTVYAIALLGTYIAVMWILTIIAQRLGYSSFRMPFLRVCILTAIGFTLMAFVFEPIRARLSMRSYEHWLRSFNDPGNVIDEEDVTLERTHDPSRRVGRPDRIFPRTVKRWMSNFLPGRRRNGGDGLPGDIYLE